MKKPEIEVSSFLGRLLVGRRPRRTLFRLLFVIFVTVILFRFLFVPIRVTGSSMAPTYRNGGVNLVNRLSYRWKEPKRGDVVAIRLAGDRVLLLKRIVGLPGEYIEVRQGTVYIDGKPLDEPYLPAKVPWPSARRGHKLGPDEYFFIGDNRSISEYYFKPRSDIVGKVLL